MPLATAVVKALVRGEVRDPFSILGLHDEGGQLFLRAWVRGAEAITAIPADGTAPIPLKLRDDAGLAVRLGELHLGALHRSIVARSGAVLQTGHSTARLATSRA